MFGHEWRTAESQVSECKSEGRSFESCRTRHRTPRNDGGLLFLAAVLEDCFPTTLVPMTPRAQLFSISLIRGNLA
jgi:hypothetical protein